MTQPTGPTEPHVPSAPVLLQVRPRKISIWASIAAGLAIAAMVVVGLLLRNTNEGVEFRTTDQVGLIGVGLVLGGVIMTAARPRLRVDRNDYQPAPNLRKLGGTEDGRCGTGDLEHNVGSSINL